MSGLCCFVCILFVIDNSLKMTSSLSQVNFQLSGSEGKALQSVCHRHSKDLRKAAGPKSVPVLQEVSV